jgi:hypothetical protein
MARFYSAFSGGRGVSDQDSAANGLAGDVRSVQLMIMNASNAAFTVDTFSLAAGDWDPKAQPRLAQPLCPGGMLNYTNSTSQPYSGVGGTLSLVPTSGGRLDINWIWVYGQPLKSGLVVTGTSLHYTLVVADQNTANALLQVTVSALAIFAVKFPARTLRQRAGMDVSTTEEELK